MVRYLPLGLEEALTLTLERLTPLGTESVTLMGAVDRIAARDLHAMVDSPSVDASLKDGYAVCSADIASASAETPVQLRVIGCAAAGGRQNFNLAPGNAIQILTGAKIPAGADAVLSEEFVRRDGEHIHARDVAEPGRNILAKGSDVALGEKIITDGQALTPGLVGFLAAAGHSCIPVYRRPRVAVIATGDEVVAPGQPLPDGKLYASNITTLGAWCRRYGLSTDLTIVRDDPQEITAALQSAQETANAIITSGGAWTGDRDMVARILEQLGWQQVFHRIRIGPGKAVGFGLLNALPVFILPGGPPSNLMGFLQIALPGLLKLAGHAHPHLPTRPVRLVEDLRGRYADWTQFVYGMVENRSSQPLFHSLANKSRLQSMAEATAVVAIPEGEVLLPAGSVVEAQCLI